MFRIFKQLTRLQNANGKHVHGKLSMLSNMTSASRSTCGCVSKSQIHTSRVVTANTHKENFHHPSDFEKRVLVFSRMYKSQDEIPETVSFNTITKAKDWMRIRVSLWMMLFTALICVAISFKGRKDRLSGDSLNKRGLKWQQDLQEQGRIEREEKAKKEAASV